METIRRQHKLIHEGEFAANVEVELIATDDGWSPYLSPQSVRLLDQVRVVLRLGDLHAASKIATVYRLTPVNAA